MSKTSSAGPVGQAERSTTGDPAAEAAQRREREVWEKADLSGKPEDYQAYLTAYPDGRFAPTAKKQLDAKAPKRVSIDTMRSMRADENSEKGMKLSGETIRDLHNRLRLLNHSPGEVRTSFNSRSRKAISAWQSQVGLLPTGYLNGAQYDHLLSCSKSQYDAWVQQGRPKLASDDGDSSSTPSQPSSSTASSPPPKPRPSTSQQQQQQPMNNPLPGIAADVFKKGIEKGLGGFRW